RPRRACSAWRTSTRCSPAARISPASSPTRGCWTRSIAASTPNLCAAMAPPASILFPTHDRHDYLAVALASVAPQAEAVGAEIVIVEDGAEDASVALLAARYGARYVVLGRPRGINVARNAALAHSTGALACFLDDDVEVWPGWLAALL